MKTTFRILGIGILLIPIAFGILAVTGLFTGSGPLAITYTKADGSPVPFGELLLLCGAIFAVLVMLPAMTIGRWVRKWLPRLPYGLLTASRIATIAVLLTPIAFTVMTLVRAISDVHAFGWTFILTEAVMIVLFTIIPAVGIGGLITKIVVSGIESETAAS